MPNPISRRRFVQSSLAVAGAAAAGGGGSLISPGPARAANAAAASTTANSKLNVAFVGTFNQAADDFDRITASKRVHCVALCDIDDDKIEQALSKPQAEGAKRFTDYRVMLDEVEKDIDAVVIAIPDNQHYHAAMHAIKRGKHVYFEKPMCHDVWEVRKLTEAAREKNVVTQMGTQVHAANYREVVEKIQAGAIGRVKRVHVWVDGAFVAGPAPSPTPPIPDGVHWDLWLGPAPERAYNPRLHPYYWRGWWDFGGGQLPDLGCHHMDLTFWALGLRAPTTIQASGPDPDPESAPRRMTCDYHFPETGEHGPVHLTWYQGDPRPKQFGDDVIPKNWGNGTLFEGEKGMLLASYGAHKLMPEDKFKDYRHPVWSIPRSIGHYNEWVAACLYNVPQAASCRFDYAGPLTETVLLGVVSHRLGNKKLEWDPTALKCPNAPEADKFLKREYRKGWEV